VKKVNDIFIRDLESVALNGTRRKSQKSKKETRKGVKPRSVEKSNGRSRADGDMEWIGREVWGSKSSVS
jgi:hypothetical protein